MTAEPRSTKGLTRIEVEGRKARRVDYLMRHDEVVAVLDCFGKCWYRFSYRCEPKEIVQQRINFGTAVKRCVSDSEQSPANFYVIARANMSEIRAAVTEGNIDMPLARGGFWYEVHSD